jgi:threonine/homoserine/homoserine lactone efflux protein
LSASVGLGGAVPALYLVAAFLVAVCPLVATPGASFALLAQRVGTGGRSEGLPVALGTITGLYVHETLAGAGLSAVVMQSSELFAVVKLAGAPYLIVLGIWTWRSASVGSPSVGRRRTVLPWAGHPTYVQALLGNVLNPKAASIYLTLMPQFLVPDQPILGPVAVLATAHSILMVFWLLVWSAVLGKVAQVMMSASFKSRINRITGALLIVLGGKSALA